MSDQEPDWLLLDRFLAGECSPAEAEQVRCWLDEHPESAAALGLFREATTRQVATEPAPATWDVDRAWSRLDEATHGDAGARYRLPAPLHRVGVGEAAGSRPGQALFNLGRVLRPVGSSWLRAAAVLLLVGGGVGGALWYRGSGASSHMVAAAARVVVTQRSERADLRLADGTRAVLAPESRLTIPADFAITRRELGLEGEGYFEVVYDSAKPFFVRAAHGIVHDLGTRFSVRAYPEDSVVEVVVAEGRVMAGLASAALPLRGPVLGRGDLARIDTAGATTVTRGVDADHYQSWTEGQLRFAAIPLREVAQQLTRWYNTDFTLADSAIGDRRVTITLRDEPLVQVISAIAQLTDTRYEYVGRGVRFSAVSGTLPIPRAPE